MWEEATEEVTQTGGKPVAAPLYTCIRGLALPHGQDGSDGSPGPSPP